MSGAGSGLGSGDSLGAMLPHHCVEQMFPDRLTRNEGGIKGPGDVLNVAIVIASLGTGFTFGSVRGDHSQSPEGGRGAAGVWVLLGPLCPCEFPGKLIEVWKCDTWGLFPVQQLWGEEFWCLFPLLS